MVKCDACGIKIDTRLKDRACLQCPNCHNAGNEHFTECIQEQEKETLFICSNCEAKVIAADTTGVCPVCNQAAEFIDIAEFYEGC